MTTNPTPLDLNAMRARAREGMKGDAFWPREVSVFAADVLALADEVDRLRATAQGLMRQIDELLDPE